MGSRPHTPTQFFLEYPPPLPRAKGLQTSLALVRHISTLWMPPTSKANRITGHLLLSPLRLLVWRRKIVECVTAVLFPVRISRISLRNTGQKKFFEEKENCSGLDGPKEQLQAEMRSLGYVERLFIYIIIHANKLPSQACNSMSEFFCFAGLMEIFSPVTWPQLFKGRITLSAE